MRLIVPVVLVAGGAIACAAASEPIVASDIYVGTSAQENACGHYGRALTARELQMIPNWCRSLDTWENYRVEAGTDIYWTARKTSHACEISPASNPDGKSLCVATVKPSATTLTSVNELFTVPGKSCDVGRLVSVDELPASFIEDPDFCGSLFAPPALFGMKLLSMVDANGHAVQMWPQFGCERVQLDDSVLAELTQDEQLVALCYADPSAYQVNAFAAKHYVNAEAPLQGRPEGFINRNISMRGSFESFKLGAGVIVEAYSGEHLDGEHQTLTASTGATDFTVQSFAVRLDLPEPEPEPTPDPEVDADDTEHAGPPSITFTSHYDTVQNMCRAEMHSSFDLTNDTVFITLMGTAEGRVPQNSAMAAVSFSYEDHSGTYSAVHYEPMPNSGECFVTNVSSRNRGPATMALGNRPSGEAVWQDLPTMPRPVDDALLAAQLVVDPFVEKLSGRREWRTMVLDAYGIADGYQTFRGEILKISADIASGYYGFSMDFLENPDPAEIRTFLQEKLIAPAIQLGLIDQELGRDAGFVEVVFQEVFAGLGQDTTHLYGSEEQVRESILALANVLPHRWQRDNLIELFGLDLDAALTGDNVYMYQHLLGDKKEPTFAEIIAAVTYSMADEEKLRGLFARNPNILVDYEKGTIAYAGRLGGYLGQTFMQVAADLFGVELDDLSADQIMITKTALEVIGIDTVYSYGSMRNVLSSVMHRMTALTDSNALAESLEDGSAPEMFAAVSTRLDDSGNNLQGQAQELLANIIEASGFPRPTPELAWKGLVDVELARDTLQSLFVTIGYEEEDNAPIEALPFTDEDWTRGYLHKLGIEADIVDAKWKSFAERGCNFFYHNGQRVCFTRLADTVYAGTTVPEAILAKEIAANEAYMARTGRTGFSPRDMWQTDFQQLAAVLGKYAGAYLELEARIRGMAPWLDDRMLTRQVRFNTRLRQQLWYLDGRTVSNYITPDYWAVQGDYMPYTVRTLPGVRNMMQLSDAKLFNKAHFEQGNKVNNRLLFEVMKPSDIGLCTQGPLSDYAPVYCGSSYNTYKRQTANNQDVLEIAFSGFLTANISEFQTVDMLGAAELRIALEILKGLLPLWGTVEAFIKGDGMGAILGVISDAMFFVPIGGKAGKLTTAVAKAMKPDLADGMRYIGSAVGINGKAGRYVVNAIPDKALYTKLAATAAKSLAKEVIDGLNPVGFIFDLAALGRPKLANKIPAAVPAPPSKVINSLESISSLYKGGVDDLPYNSTGKYWTTADGKQVVRGNDGSYYYAARDMETDTWYLTDKNGNYKAPIISDGSSWQIDTSKAVKSSDVANSVEINNIASKVRNSDGTWAVLTKDGDIMTAIEIDGHYFEANYDPVHETWYLRDADWNRTPLNGPYQGKWFHDVKKQELCVFHK